LKYSQACTRSARSVEPLGAHGVAFVWVTQWLNSTTNMGLKGAVSDINELAGRNNRSQRSIRQMPGARTGRPAFDAQA
jgi:hypothetical protein